MNQQIEEWRPVSGHPGYEVSNLGRARSVDRLIHKVSKNGNPIVSRYTGRVLKQGLGTNGYLAMCFGRDGRNEMAHRVVAIAFVDGYVMGLEVNHINGLRSDNRASNLEWVTKSENVQHSYDFLPRKQHKLTCPVIVGGIHYESMLTAANAIGVCVGSVASAFNKGHNVAGMGVSRA